MNRDDEGLRQQICSWCWEELAVLIRDGEAVCEDCFYEITTWALVFGPLLEDLRQSLEPHLLDWLKAHLDHDEEILESVLLEYGNSLFKNEMKHLIKEAVRH
jgi:hypothetical protein